MKFSLYDLINDHECANYVDASKLYYKKSWSQTINDVFSIITSVHKVM